MSGFVTMLGDQTVTVTALSAADTYAANGVANARTFAAPVSIRGSVQPVAGQDLKLVPEGELVSEWRTVYAATPMPTSSKVTLADSSTWEVRVANDWRSPGNFGRALIKRFDKDEPRS